MKRNSLTIIILSVVAILLIWNFFFTDKDESKKLADGLMKSHSIDHSYDSLVKSCFDSTIAQMGLGYNANINKEFDSDRLNIYIVNFDSLPSLTGSSQTSFERFVSIAKNNFLAFPPNVIIIDKYFIGYLILNCYNENLSYFQSIEAIQANGLTGGEEIGEFMSTSSAISTYLSVGNYDWYRTKERQEVSMDSLAGTIAEVSIASPELMGTFLFYLLPIISHELAHIHYQAQQPSGWFDLKESLRRQLSTYKEEQRADDLALRTINQCLQKKGVNQNNFISLISFCRTMRNMVLADTYENFRDMQPADLIVTLEQKQDLTEEELKLPFEYFERVQRGYENTLPTMTEDEFGAFRQKLYDSGSNISHRHMFQRCEPILKLVEAHTKAEIHFLDDYLGLLALSPDNKKAVDSLFMEGVSQPSTGLSRSKIIRHLSNNIDFRKAINFRNNKTEIGFLKNKGGYIQLIGDTTDLTSVTMVVKTRGKDGQIDEDAVTNLASLIRFVANAHQDDAEGQRNALAAHARFRNSQGSLPTFYARADRNLIKYTPVNESFFIRIEVLGE